MLLTPQVQSCGGDVRFPKLELPYSTPYGITGTVMKYYEKVSPIGFLYSMPYGITGTVICDTTAGYRASGVRCLSSKCTESGVKPVI